MHRKANVLAVDDTPANLVALEAVLGREHNLILAGSGPEALAVLEKRADIDIVLMDLQMPKMDGFEAAAKAKVIPGYEDLPIIFITAIYKEEPYVRRGYEVGGIDYFSKPFDPEVLKKKVAIYSSFRQKAGMLRERERQIRASEEVLQAGRKLSSMLESLPVGVLISDIDGRICQTNEEVSRICKSIEPMARDSYGELLGWWSEGGKSLKDASGPLGRALKAGQTTHNDIVQIRCFDGSSKTLVASSSPLLGMNQEIMGAVIVIQDLTESKKIEEDLEQRITRLISVGVEIEQSVSQ